jgi:hypothetical protein
MNPRLIAAYHESGHIVAALVLGNRVTEAQINANRGGLCRECPPAHLDERTKAARFYIITCAGRIATMRRFGPAGGRLCK